MLQATQILNKNFQVGWSVSQTGKLLLVFASAVILGSKPCRTNGHVFLSHNSE
jgi:hypothetical protein